MALIGEDCAVSIQFGTQVALGGTITWGTSLSITGIAKKISDHGNVELVNTKAIGGARKRHRAHSGMDKIDIEGVVGATNGFSFVATGRSATPVGQPVKVTLLENSALSTPMVFAGLCETWDADLSQGEATIEKMSITCDIDLG